MCECHQQSVHRIWVWGYHNLWGGLQSRDLCDGTASKKQNFAILKLYLKVACKICSHTMRWQPIGGTSPCRWTSHLSVKTGWPDMILVITVIWCFSLNCWKKTPSNSENLYLKTVSAFTINTFKAVHDLPVTWHWTDGWWMCCHLLQLSLQFANLPLSDLQKLQTCNNNQLWHLSLVALETILFFRRLKLINKDTKVADLGTMAAPDFHVWWGYMTWN